MNYDYIHYGDTLVIMAVKVKPKRPYHSDLRQQQAEATRERILEAAVNRFTANGYVATTMTAIAQQAQIATPTLYLIFKNKAALLTELITRAIFGTDAPWSSAEGRRWYQVLQEQPDARTILRRHVAYVIHVNRKLAPLQQIAEGAADADADIAALWRRVIQQRMQGQRLVAQLLADRGGLASGLEVTRASDIIWAMTDARLYHSLVLGRRWSDAAFEQWLFTSLCATLLQPAAVRL
jgi:AcrR family transcriptional regulator